MLDKSIEGPSKILTRKWNHQNQLAHFEKLAHMKATLNIGSEPHIIKFNKKKANILQEERCTEIERENRILFEKLAKIKLLGSNASSSSNPYFKTKLSNEPNSTRYIERDNSIILKRKQEQRKRENKKILNENLRILERLRNSKGTIDSSQFALFEARHKMNLKRLQEFQSPTNLGQSSLRAGASVRSGTTMKYQNESQQTFRKNNMSTIEKVTPLKLPAYNQSDLLIPSNERQESSYRKRSTRKLKRNHNNIDRNLTPLTANFMPDLQSKRDIDSQTHSKRPRKLLYKCKIVVDLNGKQMNLEIQKDHKKFYIRAVPLNHKDRAQEVEIHLKQAQQLMLIHDNDYEKFVNETLYLKNGKLLLKDFNKQKYRSLANIYKSAQDRSYQQSVVKDQSFSYNQENQEEGEEEKLPQIIPIIQSHQGFNQNSAELIRDQDGNGSGGDVSLTSEGHIRQQFSFSQNGPYQMNIDVQNQ